jgi:hypothetical protein
MKRITVTSQAEYDALPKTFTEYTVIDVNAAPELTIHVEAWGSSHVEAWESSHVVAWGSVAVHLYSDSSVAILFAFAVAWVTGKAKVILRSKTATKVVVKWPNSTKEWIETEGVDAKPRSAVVFKRVSRDLKTQEGTANETVWTIGATLKHHDYRPKEQECGGGKFHACSRPYFCDEFRDTAEDRYVAIKVPLTSLHFWGSDAAYQHKVAFGEGKVMYECDRYGAKLPA